MDEHDSYQLPGLSVAAFLTYLRIYLFVYVVVSGHERENVPNQTLFSSVCINFNLKN